MQLRAVARRCTTGSVTVLGDIAQATTPWATGSWSVALEHLGKSEAHIEELTQGFRVPRQIIEYAARLLPAIAPELAPPTSVRQQGGGLDVRRVATDAQLRSELIATVHRALADEGSVGLIAADAELDGIAKALADAGLPAARLDAEEPQDEVSPEAAQETGRLVLVPATLAKGLEYDQVIVVEPGAIAEAEHDELLGLRRLYVVLTRAVTRLTVLHTRPLPARLAI
jgi:DNA helicase IV